MHEEDITKYINENACHKKFVNYINSQINRNWLAKNIVDLYVRKCDIFDLQPIHIFMHSCFYHQVPKPLEFPQCSWSQKGVFCYVKSY